jgi:hypothetical protein
MNEQLHVCRDRTHLPQTGIYVRATDGDSYAPHDIAHLSLDSLMRWLRSRGGDNQWAESCLAMILGHSTDAIEAWEKRKAGEP